MVLEKLGASSTKLVSTMLLMILASNPALSQEMESCTAKISGNNLYLSYPAEGQEYDEFIDNTTFREIFFAGWGGGCPGYIVLKHMTPELSPAQRAPFCLSYDKDAGSYIGFEEGDRDAYGVCKKPNRTVCERVNASKNTLLAITGFAAGATAGTTVTASTIGVTAVTHSSGAVILTGSSGYITATLGTTAASALGIVTAPATIASAAVGLVAVGGAVYVCQE